MDGCVTVQVNQAEEENMELLTLAARHDFIKGIVGWIDLHIRRMRTGWTGIWRLSEIERISAYAAGREGQGVDVEAGF